MNYEQKVVAFVQERPESTVRDMSVGLGIRERWLLSVIRRLEERGWLSIKKNDSGAERLLLTLPERQS